MLKCIAVVLSLMVLVMGAIPCSDSEECQETAEVQHQIESERHQDVTHVDLCTPFCTCQCCHTHVTQIGFLDLDEFNYFQHNLRTNNNPLVEGIAILIWDPPRSNC